MWFSCSACPCLRISLSGKQNISTGEKQDGLTRNATSSDHFSNTCGGLDVGITLNFQSTPKRRNYLLRLMPIQIGGAGFKPAPPILRRELFFETNKIPTRDARPVACQRGLTGLWAE